jgi:hypothetical protein
MLIFMFFLLGFAFLIVLLLFIGGIIFEIKDMSTYFDKSTRWER